MDTPNTQVPPLPPERERPNRNEWKGAVRCGAPPASVPTPPPMPPQTERLALLIALHAWIALGAAWRLLRGGPTRPATRRAAYEAALREGFVDQLPPALRASLAAEYEARTSKASQAGGLIPGSNGPNESPCSDCAAGRSTDQESPR